MERLRRWCSYRGDRDPGGRPTFPAPAVPVLSSASARRGVLQQVGVDGFFGQDVDFANVRAGPRRQRQPQRDDQRDRPSGVRADRQHDVAACGRRRRRRASRCSRPACQRVRANYTFTARSFVRLIGQYVSTDRDPSLYVAARTPRTTGSFSGSVLFAYKINWQSVMFFGYGDDRDARRAAPAPEVGPPGLRQAVLRFQQYAAFRRPVQG